MVQANKKEKNRIYNKPILQKDNGLICSKWHAGENEMQYLEELQNKFQ